MRRARSAILAAWWSGSCERRVRTGKPCFLGTRIVVYDVLEYLASGTSIGEIVADFPELTPEHVRAATEFAALREPRLATA